MTTAVTSASASGHTSTDDLALSIYVKLGIATQLLNQVCQTVPVRPLRLQGQYSLEEFQALADRGSDRIEFKTGAGVVSQQLLGTGAPLVGTGAAASPARFPMMLSVSGGLAAPTPPNFRRRPLSL